MSKQPNQNKDWTPEMDNYLKNNLGKGINHLINHFGKTKTAVKARVVKLRADGAFDIPIKRDSVEATLEFLSMIKRFHIEMIKSWIQDAEELDKAFKYLQEVNQRVKESQEDNLELHSSFFEAFENQLMDEYEDKAKYNFDHIAEVKADLEMQEMKTEQIIKEREND